jgi:hypothetical protein
MWSGFYRQFSSKSRKIEGIGTESLIPEIQHISLCRRLIIESLMRALEVVEAAASTLRSA